MSKAIQYNIQLEKLCNYLELGKLIKTPEAIAGGLLHKMYAIETTQGKYAIKALNPQIIRRPTAMKHYIDSEQIARIASKHIPTLPALVYNNASLQEIEKQCYLIFHWVDGKSLQPEDIRIEHCERIGEILAKLHMTDFSLLAIPYDASHNVQTTDWNNYLIKGKENNLSWVTPLQDIIDQLYNWHAEAILSAEHLSSNRVMSHRDLDPKNVLWNGDNPILIDWESAGYTNPMHDLVETAIYWSEDQVGSINKQHFLSLINSYKKQRTLLKTDWKKVLYNGFINKLGWLEYNMKRSLWIECTDKEERQLGIAQVNATLNNISKYGSMIHQLEEWLQMPS